MQTALQIASGLAMLSGVALALASCALHGAWATARPPVLITPRAQPILKEAKI